MWTARAIALPFAILLILGLVEMVFRPFESRLFLPRVGDLDTRLGPAIWSATTASLYGVMWLGWDDLGREGRFAGP